MPKTDNRQFISFEGIDFSGKSTQIAFLAESLHLRGYNVMILREPGGTYISEKIRDILLDKSNQQMLPLTEALLYSAARHQLVKESIVLELQKGNFVLADRYVDSTTAYQGFGRKLPSAFIKLLNKQVTVGVMPYITFYLDLDYEESVQRHKLINVDLDRMESAGRDFYERIRKGYLKIAEINKTRVKIINACQPVEKIKNEIWEFVSQKLNLE